MTIIMQRLAIRSHDPLAGPACATHPPDIPQHPQTTNYLIKPLYLLKNGFVAARVQDRSLLDDHKEATVGRRHARTARLTRPTRPLDPSGRQADPADRPGRPHRTFRPPALVRRRLRKLGLSVLVYVQYCEISALDFSKQNIAS